MAEEYTRWNTLSETEAAAKLGIKQPSVHYLISTGALPVVEVPGFKVPRVPLSALEKGMLTRRGKQHAFHAISDILKQAVDTFKPSETGIEEDDLILYVTKHLWNMRKTDTLASTIRRVEVHS